MKFLQLQECRYVEGSEKHATCVEAIKRHSIPAALQVLQTVFPAERIFMSPRALIVLNSQHKRSALITL